MQTNRGRRPRPDPQLTANICALLEASATFAAACQAHGVNDKLALEWMRRGEGRHPKRPARPCYVDFFEAVMRAKAKAQVRNVAVIWQAAEDTVLERTITVTRPNGDVVTTTETKTVPGDWRAAAWILSRSDRKNWGDSRQPAEAASEDTEDGPIKILEFGAIGA